MSKEIHNNTNENIYKATFRKLKDGEVVFAEEMPDFRFEIEGETWYISKTISLKRMPVYDDCVSRKKQSEALKDLLKINTELVTQVGGLTLGNIQNVNIESWVKLFESCRNVRDAMANSENVKDSHNDVLMSCLFINKVGENLSDWNKEMLEYKRSQLEKVSTPGFLDNGFFFGFSNAVTFQFSGRN